LFICLFGALFPQYSSFILETNAQVGMIPGISPVSILRSKANSFSYMVYIAPVPMVLVIKFHTGSPKNCTTNGNNDNTLW
jgi:hypothetical protein